MIWTLYVGWPSKIKLKVKNQNRLITLKLFILGTKFVWVTDRKSYMGFQIVLSPFILDDLERSYSRSHIKIALFLWNGSFKPQSLYQWQIGNHIWAFKWWYYFWCLMNLKGHELERSKVKVTNLFGLITLKRFILGPKFVLVTYRKSHVGFQMVLSPFMVDDLERSNSRSKVKIAL